MTKKKETEPAPNPNMELWNRLCKTNPANTKQVKKSAQSREFTAVDAHSQVMAATEQWGPCGGGWGFSWEWIPDPDMWVASVTLRYPAKTSAPGFVGGTMECKVSQVGTKKRKNKYGVEDDAPKMAITDGLTKCFSYTGMNADIFLGKWESNKYVAEMREEFGLNPSAPLVVPGKPDRSQSVPHDTRATGKARIKQLAGNLCGDKDWFDWLQDLAANLGFPMDPNDMNDEQFTHIQAELEGLDQERLGEIRAGQQEQPTLGGVPMAAYKDGDDIPF
jgi:hypothetical protein